MAFRSQSARTFPRLDNRYRRPEACDTQPQMATSYFPTHGLSNSSRQDHVSAPTTEGTTWYEEQCVEPHEHFACGHANQTVSQGKQPEEQDDNQGVKRDCP